MTTVENPRAKLVADPTIFVMAEMGIVPDAYDNLLAWLKEFAPECLDPKEEGLSSFARIFPHDGMREEGVFNKVTDNELLVEVSGRKCCDAETEVLAERGWVRFPDLRPDDKVATYSMERDRLEFQMPTDRIEKEFSGQMYVVESRALSLRVTEDHELLVQRKAWKTSEPWAFHEAKAMAGLRYKIRRTAGSLEDEPVDAVTSIARFFHEWGWVRSGFPPPSLSDWAEFIGYYISEGTIGGGKDYGTGEHVRIYQKPEGMAPILSCAERVFGESLGSWKDPRNGVEAVVINRTEVAHVLREHCGHGSWEKRIPRQAFSWPRSTRERLLDAMMYGDGHEDEYGHRIYNTCNEGLADDVQRLMLLNGFPATIGRRVSHELIRHYVGADRDEEGSPSQESTRYTHHSGHFSLHPRMAGDPRQTEQFLVNMNEAYAKYVGYIDREVDEFKRSTGLEPKGMDRKRIYEAAAQLLPGAACTSFTWTTNPMALAKLFTERCDYAADLEIQRFACKLRNLSYGRWPNLFMASNPAIDR